MNQRDMNWTSASRFKPGDKINLRVSFSSGGVTLTPVSGEGLKASQLKGLSIYYLQVY